MHRTVAIAILLLTATAARPARADKVEELTHALVNDPSYKVRVQAALELGRLGDYRAVPPLLRALHDSDETVRGMVVQALAALGDARALEPLRDALDDPSASVRSQAEKVLPAFEAALRRPPP